MLAGMTRDNDRAIARVQGAREALAAAGIPLPQEWLVERSYGIAAARDGFRCLMATQPRPTAIICGNDVLAIGAILEASKMGLQVPRDLSIVGFDDLELASQMSPSLTTVRVPSEDMWRTAADHLLAAIAGEAHPLQTEVELSLIARESTGAAPRDKP
jgi:LacI family transcriptional regulator